LVEGAEQRPLFINQQLRITDDVDEKDVPDLKLNFLLNLGGHPVKLPEKQSK
jgi:hypothetical protein